MKKNTAILNGLVLAGGKSQRLGQDKSKIAWHGMAQPFYLVSLLQDLCNAVFISHRPEQSMEQTAPYDYIPDAYQGLGPYGAILSAFQREPNAAWFVVACDLPLVDKNTLCYLLENRDRSAIATAFQSPRDQLPEPLITIWEEESRQWLLSLLSQGYSCPRKALIHSNKVHVIQPPNPAAFLNVNTPEDFQMAREILNYPQWLSNG